VVEPLLPTGVLTACLLLDGGYRDLPDLQSNPYFEPLRRDPRFARMLAKHGIDPGPAR